MKGRITLALVAVCGALAAVPSASVAVPRDRDRDGLTNRFEKLRSHTSPSRADTDRDGLKDGLEVRRTHTNPRKRDTDADGVTDGLEVMLGTNPRRKQKPPRDTTPPETYMMDGPVGTVPSSSASFSFISSEPGSSFQCRLDTGSWGACTSPKAYAGLADGAHTFAVRATDQGGNTDATPATGSWTVATSLPPVDSTPPETTITSGPSGTVSSASASFGFSASEIGSSFECRLDAGAWGSCTSPKAYSGLADGTHTFAVRATDLFANTDATPATRTWTVATSAAPTASFTWSPQNPQNPPVTVTFTSTGTCPATPCTYQWTHGPPGNEPIGTGQTASWTFQSTGDKTVVLTVTDALGRTAQATRTVTVSSGSPPPPPADADGDGVPDSSDQCPGTPAGTQVDATGCPTTTPPPSGGYPDASNTGVPAGTTLTPSGGMTINTAGAVIDARDISGPVVVNAPNVTIKRSRIRSNAMWLVESNSTGLVIEDSELINKPVSGQNNCHNTIGSGNFTVRRSEMTGCENAANIDGDNVTMTDNYIHDLDTTGPSYVWGNEPHTDGLQMSPGANNVVIRHNWIDPTAGGGATSAIIMGVNGSQSNVWIENNYLDGRNASYAIYANRSASPNVHINGNRMLRGVGGYTACVKLGNTVTTFTDNRDFTTGALLTPDNGAGNSCNN